MTKRSKNNQWAFINRKQRCHPFISVLLLLLISACSNNQNDNPTARIQAVENQALAYFQTYADRTDWDQFCSYYRDDLHFEDVLLQLKLDSLWQFKRFYNWPDTNFSKLSPEQETLVINTLVCNDSVAVARGYFTPFIWYGQRMEPIWGMEATFWLFFDENLKIYKQIDWIEYDPNVLESVIQRVRTKGVQPIPDWLDLSR